MNFYKHHIGDYAQATSHLSFVEDAAYSRLIRKYYAEERPLPADLKAVQRLVGARTREEKNAVVSVLEEFFSLEADGWRNKRCDEELAQWKAQAETNRRIAAEREARKSKKTVKNSETDRPRNENESSNESLNESSTSTSGEREPNQNPEARIQNPEAIDQKTCAETDKSVPAIRTLKAEFNYSTSQFENLSAEMLAAWRDAYPAIDVRQEIAKAKAWLLANPKNRKSNIERFLTNWLVRAQDNAPRLQHGTHQRNSGKPDLDFDSTDWGEDLGAAFDHGR